MNKCMIILAAVLFLRNLNAQQSGWPPSPDHLTLPLWPGVAPGEPVNMPAEADTHHGQR